VILIEKKNREGRGENLNCFVWFDEEIKEILMERKCKNEFLFTLIIFKVI